MVLGLSFSLLLGCSPSEKSFKARRDADIRFNTQRLNSTRSKVVLKWSQDILSALETVNSSNILKPRLASAILAKSTNGVYGLFVFWIENYPSVDSIEFAFHEPQSAITNVRLSIELKQVQGEAKVGIVFGSEDDWRGETEMWKHLEEIVTTNNLKVRLFRDKAPVTDWFPVDFFKMDRWLSDGATNK